MTTRLNPQTLAQLFTEARTFSAWQDKAVPSELLHELYELTRSLRRLLSMDRQLALYLSPALKPKPNLNLRSPKAILTKP